ncbi:hypothetical protein GCM10009122_05840 [Fulvivirga kasyanovii]|uniref:DUF4468 domain-containing protein n=1 Tax=Fulvivirga kasyanovii TaxID=396812 RepID=A0ABW9RSA2_9BACT|nr:hypothetical protein [Fulvivirga kasyanovii]MTI27052.1 hypothetical protein [Fulvivirga kasyanovii]
MSVLVHILIFNNLLLFVNLLGTPVEPEFPAFYEKIVPCKGQGQAAIYNQIVQYFNDQETSAGVDSTTLLISKDKLRIYSRILGELKKPVGKVVFNIRVDIKDEKFRLILYEPWFTLLVRDRYGKLVYDDKAEKVVEENFKHRLSLYRKIESQLQTYIDNAGEEIREGMAKEELNITNW